MKTLFVTASAQAEANYYLIWHFFKMYRTDIDHIVIISTDFSQKQGFVDNLQNILTSTELALGEERL